MKRIILVFCMLTIPLAIAMEPLRQRTASGRGNSLMVRHKRHSSLGNNVSATLLKTDKSQDSNMSLESQSNVDSLARSNSRNLTGKAGDKNRKHCTERTQLAFAAIKNIKAENDTAHKEYLSHLKYAEYYFISGMSLEITKDPRSLKSLVDMEFRPLKDECAKQMALIALQKK